MYLMTSVSPVCIWMCALAAHSFVRCLNFDRGTCCEGARRVVTVRCLSMWRMLHRQMTCLLTFTPSIGDAFDGTEMDKWV